MSRAAAPPDHAAPAAARPNPAARSREPDMHPEADIAIRLFRSGILRPKLVIGGSGDPEEKAADRLADGAAGEPCCASCAGGGACEDTLHMKADTSALRPAATASPAVEAGARALGGGEPLPPRLKGLFEPRFGRAVETVRLQTGESAGRMAQAIGARAFALGSSVAFAPGQFQPATREGRHLIAHELAHVALGHGGVRRQPAPDPAAQPAGPPQPEAGPAVRRPNSDWYYFRNVMMSADAAFMLTELRLLIKRGGIKGGDFWFDALNGRGFEVDLPFSAHARAFGGLRVHTPLDAKWEMDNNARRDKIAPVAIPLAQALYPVVRAEAVKFLADFQKEMNDTLMLVLAESEQRINVEREKYGIRKVFDRKAGRTVYEADPTVAFQGLAAAAKDLAAMRAQITDVQRQQAALTGDGERANARRAELEQKRQQLETEYGHARTGAAQRYPALGAILDDYEKYKATTPLVLRSIARGDLKTVPPGYETGPSGAAHFIGHVLDSRQESIDTVRDKTRDHPGKVWSIPSILALTRAVAHTSETVMGDTLIEEHLANLALDEQIKSLFLVIVTLALAIPTGGTSLAAGAAAASFALTAYQAMQSIQNYQLQMALTQTDLDKKAYAISSEEPSLFWLALDIAFVFLDGAQALKAFRALKGEARLALAAKEGTEIAAADERLMKSIDGLEGGEKATLAARLRESLGRLRKTAPEARELGALGKAEAETTARAVQGIAKEAKTAETVAEIGGHEVKVTSSGHIVICTECSWLRERFAPEIAADKELGKRLRAAEDNVRLRGGKTPALKAEIESLSKDLQAAQKARITVEIGPAGARKIEQLNKQLNNLREDFARQLEVMPEFDKEARRIEAIVDPSEKAAAISQLRKDLMEVPGYTIWLSKRAAKRLARAEGVKKWTDLPGMDRTSLGKRYGYIVEDLTREIAKGGRAQVLHYAMVDEKLIAAARKKGGRLLITQGRLKGGAMRFDIAEIDFAKQHVELIDLTPKGDKAHLAGTIEYAQELHRLTGFRVSASEMHYVGDAEELLGELKHVDLGEIGTAVPPAAPARIETPSTPGQRIRIEAPPPPGQPARIETPSNPGQRTRIQTPPPTGQPARIETPSPPGQRIRIEAPSSPAQPARIEMTDQSLIDAAAEEEARVEEARRRSHR